WPPKVTLGRLLPHARGLGFKPRRGGFPSGAKKEWGLSPKANVRVLHTAQLDVTMATKGNLGEVVTICERSWVQALPWGFSFRSWLSKWKEKPLSIGGRLTLLKSVLGATPLYSMSIFKVPRGTLKMMEAIRSRFFNGAGQIDKKITWVAWDKVLASKENGGLGVFSFLALNRALLLKWVWRFVSHDGSLWCRVIQALYGSSINSHPIHISSNWCSIVRELHTLKVKGFDFWSHCKKRIGNGNDT
nr:RNA-directed DNA polymerase, eukaryota [Tanacetum cinerariifolium]